MANRDIAVDALRWVVSQAVSTQGGVTWLEHRDRRVTDLLYDGTAGVLLGLAEARLSGIADFDDTASAAAAQLRQVVAQGEPPDIGRPEGDLGVGLYTGLAGQAAALRIWAAVSGDESCMGSARIAVAKLAAIAANRRCSQCRDVISGEAGVLLTLADLADAGPDVRPAVAAIAERLVAEAVWTDDGPDWYMTDGFRYLTPNFSHGAAGVGLALALASELLNRPDLLDIAAQAGRRLVRLGTRPDGTLAVPYTIPPHPEVSVNYGWCHGPAGTLRLFQVLDRLKPGERWADQAEGGRRAVRASGLPARLYPGFWDNIGQCCGTAGVGEMALDRYCESADPQWLAWAQMLAGDITERAITDDAGTRWSHTEHRVDPPLLEPEVGWMQGAAGIAGFLLRLDRVSEQGVAAATLRLPDKPLLSGAADSGTARRSPQEGPRA